MTAHTTHWSGDDPAELHVGAVDGCGDCVLSDSQRIARDVGFPDDHPWISGCGCWTCTSDRVAKSDNPWSMPMCVCADCGNKRCPRASHHNKPCTGSNDPGQDGSRYA